MEGKRTMHIIVCLKIVKGNLVSEEIQGDIINPYDLFALIQAIAIKKEINCRVTCITMGHVAPIINAECKSIGCDDVIFISDLAFKGADTLATSYTIAKAINKFQDYTYIFCGDHSIDGETGHIGIALAERLGMEYLGKVDYVDSTDSQLYFVCSDKEKQITYQALKPTVISFDNLKLNKYVSLITLKRAKTLSVNVWNRNDLDVDLVRCGVKGSKTKVLEVHPIQKCFKRERKTIDGTIDEKADFIMKRVGINYDR